MHDHEDAGSRPVLQDVTNPRGIDLTGMTPAEQVAALGHEGHDALAYGKFGQVVRANAIFTTDDGQVLHGTLYLG